MSMRKHARVRKPAATNEPASSGMPNLDPQPLNTPQPNAPAPASGHSFANVRVFHSDAGRSPQRAAVQRAAAQQRGTSMVQRADKPKEEQKPERFEPIAVREDVELVGQPLPDTAWSAGLAMLATHADDENRAFDPQTIATATGLELEKRQDWNEIRKAAGALELAPSELPETAPTPQIWAQILSEHGPFWLVENDQPDHSLLVGAMSGDGTVEKTDLTIYLTKPENNGRIDTKSFKDVIEEFRLQEPDHPKTSIVHGQ